MHQYDPLLSLLVAVLEAGGAVQVRVGALTLFETRFLLPWSSYLLVILVLVVSVLAVRGKRPSEFARGLRAASMWLLCRPRIWVALLALWSLAFGFLVHHLVLGGRPHIQDAIAYRFQAEILSQGLFWVPAPPETWRSGIFFEFCPFYRGRWFGYSPGGFPALLALGLRLGVPSLVNPLLNALSLICFYLATRSFLGRRASMLAVTVLGFSPFFLFMGASQMSHPAMLALVCVGMWLHARELCEGPSSVHFIGLSALAAFGLNVRPLTTVALLGTLWLDMAFARIKARRPVELLGGCLVGLSGLGATYAYNRAVTGDGFLSPLFAAFPKISYGFGIQVFDGLASTHGSFTGLFNLLLNLYSLDIQLLGLPLLAIALLVLGMPRSWRCLPRAWFAGGGLLVAGYFGWFHAGTCFGPRFYYGLLPLLSVTVALGAMSLSRLLRARVPFHLPTFLVLLWLGAAISTFPLRFRQLRHYWQVYPGAVNFLQDSGIRGRVVIIPPELHSTFFLENGPFFNGENVFWTARASTGPPEDFLALRRGGAPLVFSMQGYLDSRHY